MEFKAGDKVKFAFPENELEQGLVMVVVEDRGERVLVAQPGVFPEGSRITPQAAYWKADLVAAE